MREGGRERERERERERLANVQNHHGKGKYFRVKSLIIITNFNCKLSKKKYKRVHP